MGNRLYSRAVPDRKAIQLRPHAAQPVEDRPGPEPEPEPVANGTPVEASYDTTATLESELGRLRAEVDTLRSRLGRGAFERYELPIFIVIAALLIALIVIQVRG